ncbi:nucleotide disphospho-sugar-binding domain-containing protein [Streptomyces sp. NPDC086010]|uniref:nucleotide disphospho-sugar-binding domain-containing protein n=1 Tax=Streptomyces sp. NPDC086010 TaxID=3365745 RepID=UPI0037D5877A
MAKIIVTSVATHAHFAPLVAIAADLTRRGHEVLFYTGARFEKQVLAAGARLAPYPAEFDRDETDLIASYAGYEELNPFERMALHLKHLFFDPTPAHDKRLQELLADFPATVVIGETASLGTLPMVLRSPREERPLLIQIGITPPTFESVDTAPFGPGMLPPTNDEERARYAEMRPQTRAMFSGIQQTAEDAFRAAGVELPDFVFNAWATVPDHLLQLSVPSFEYPRSDAPENFRFIGALPAWPGAGFDRPDWWAGLSDGRPVVVVTQGTVANHDLSQLVVPTLRALADADVTVVAATGRSDGPDLVRAAMGGDVPANVHLADFVPFEQLLPLADVLVTNGGYGGVQAALRHGLPLVVGGETEDKPEVAARVEWSGTGVDLRTSSPEAAAVRAAVDQVLNEPGYRDRARAMQREMADHQPFDAIAELVEGA